MVHFNISFLSRVKLLRDFSFEMTAQCDSENEILSCETVLTVEK